MGESAWKVAVLLAGNWRGATSVLISNGRHYLVVDTGMPHEAHQLVKALQEKGLQPTDITGVINTHFHVDHALNNSLFPKSLIYATQEAYDWSRSLYSDLLDEPRWEKLILRYYPETFQYEKARRHMGKLRQVALRWWDSTRLGESSQFRWVETQPLPEGLEGLVTSGHVPGHISVIVRAGEQRTIITGDALLSRDEEERVLTMIPHNRKQYHLDRARVLSMGGCILPGHDREFSASSGPGVVPGPRLEDCPKESAKEPWRQPR